MPQWIASMFVCAQDIPVHRQSTRRLSLRFHSDASQQPSTEVLRAAVTVAVCLVECSGRASVYADTPAVRARVRAQTIRRRRALAIPFTPRLNRSLAASGSRSGVSQNLHVKIDTTKGSRLSRAQRQNLQSLGVSG